MANKIITSYPSQMPDSKTSDYSGAYAEVPRILAGKSRWLYEMATGESGVSTEKPAIPKNPQNLYGVDHSGPPYGPAVQHPICYGQSHHEQADGYWDISDNLTNDFAHVLPLLTTTTHEAILFVRAHAATGDAPYGDGYLDFSTFSTGTDDITITASSDSSPGDVTATVTYASGADTHTSALVLPLSPGWQKIKIAFRNNSASTSVTLVSWSLGQKRQV